MIDIIETPQMKKEDIEVTDNVYSPLLKDIRNGIWLIILFLVCCS